MKLTSVSCSLFVVVHGSGCVVFCAQDLSPDPDLYVSVLKGPKLVATATVLNLSRTPQSPSTRSQPPLSELCETKQTLSLNKARRDSVLFRSAGHSGHISPSSLSLV